MAISESRIFMPLQDVFFVFVYLNTEKPMFFTSCSLLADVPDAQSPIMVCPVVLLINFN